ncbi:MAG: low specificity L-threonine aldolase [Deltaproteobacteria bacterium]|nr:low specificity L-threonine aldolase [Deltaproteobacteria bacterium]
MTNNAFRGFASDNNSGVHPEIMEAIARANQGHAIAYGDDPYTKTALRRFKATFGRNIEVYFVYNGTAANVLGLKSATRSFNSVICAETAHINVDECAAPEKFCGCKLLPVATRDGKLRPPDIEKHLHGFDFEHHAQPGVISITQPTELGTLYTPDEIRAVVDLAGKHGLIVHMDGARIANAAVALNADLKAVTGDLGIDVLSFGGTKNGMMFGEAIVFFNPKLAENFKYIRKQGMQLNSKMRFISAQFDAYLSNGLWERNAGHANALAQRLKRGIDGIPVVSVTQKVETNGVFAVVPEKHIPALQDAFFFYVWDASTSEVRWMTSFDTQAEDVDAFVQLLRTTF